MDRNLYFDNSATSFPKPKAVAEGMRRYLDEVGGPYGRSSYPRVVEVGRTVERARDRLGILLGAKNGDQVVFTPSATVALNIVIASLPANGGRVLVSPLEHNAVMRPLQHWCSRTGGSFQLLPASLDGTIRVEEIGSSLSPDTRLVIVNHMGNVNGVIQPIKAIKRAIGSLPLLVDASQSLGSVPVRADEWNLDFVAFAGHKSLLGPPGIGGLFLRDHEALSPLVLGGTGSVSESYDMPGFLPDRFEAGTGNIAGAFGLLGALEEKPPARHTHRDFLHFIAGMKKVKGLNVLAAGDPEAQGEVVSVTHRNLLPSALGDELFKKHGLEVRVGLHCAPLAHRWLKTFPNGTVRIAPSVFHSPEDLDFFLDALQSIGG